MARTAIETVAVLAGVLSSATVTALEDCCNRIDDDGDGLIDFQDADCATHPECFPVPFRRGDVDLDGNVNVTDVVVLLGLAFGGLPDPFLGCDEPRDVDDSGSIEVTDAVVLLEWLFRSGPAPPEPFTECGLDTTPDSFRCLTITTGC